MDYYSLSTSPDDDPVANNSEQRRLMRAAEQLADLLAEAQPLIEILNSPDTRHIYRAVLRYRVGLDKYLVLVGGLQAMTSVRAWQAVHATQFISPELLQRLHAQGVYPGNDAPQQ